MTAEPPRRPRPRWLGGLLLLPLVVVLLGSPTASHQWAGIPVVYWLGLAVTILIAVIVRRANR